MTQEQPPRKPRRARWWAWTVCAACITYVGCYVWLRTTDRLTAVALPSLRVAPDGNGGSRRVRSSAAPELAILDVEYGYANLPRAGEQVDWYVNWRLRAFRPCIAVEEWWRNR